MNRVPYQLVTKEFQALGCTAQLLKLELVRGRSMETYPGQVIHSYLSEDLS